jgi:hypothetical protein
MNDTFRVPAGSIPQGVAALLLLLLSSLIHAAQPASGGPSALGLLRIDGRAASPASSLATNMFTLDALAPLNNGATRARQNDTDYLALIAGGEWSRPLRGVPQRVSFVSFQAFASENSIIEAAGARLGVTVSSANGCLQLMYDDSTHGALQWRSLGMVMRAEPHDGRILAPLPVITLRIDPEQNVWDVFSDARLLAAGLPLIATRKSDRNITFRAGSDGMWISGLVFSDENPLYEDSNENGVDDRFELEQRGVLLPVHASAPERAFLAEQWKSRQRETPGPILVFKRPLPDRALAGQVANPFAP